VNVLVKAVAGRAGSKPKNTPTPVATAKAVGMAPPEVTIRETLNKSSYVVPAQAGTQKINALDFRPQE
jgi:hypothetical protein